MTRRVLAILLTLSALSTLSAADNNTFPVGWETAAPRDEIRPRFTYDAKGGRNGTGGFVISADKREGLHGFWTTTVPVAGGQHYRFRAMRKIKNVALPRRSAVARILWQDASGKPVNRDTPAATEFQKGTLPWAEPEYPSDGATDKDGWTEVADVYRAPEKAAQAVIELHLLWAPNGKIIWSDAALTKIPPPAGRKVRLAAVHHRPAGKSPAEICREFAPLIEDAARQKADLVVLPETLTIYPVPHDYAGCAEPIPGPATEYFGTLAKKHNLYLVVGLVERDAHLLYNVAVLIGPDGAVAGKYRKVCLPRTEVLAGIAPGNDYPVFQTRFGKVGMMVCFDGFFPEVARHLSNRGAEVIAWPVWGCNPVLASARACENHTYIVSSTYMDVSSNWMITAIFDHEGKIMAQAKQWSSVIVTEVDLDARLQWPGLGDFKAQLPRHRPPSKD